MIYVTDLLGDYPVDGDWPFCRHCFLLADSCEELIAFMKTLVYKYRPEHCHTSRRGITHFYLTAGQRRSALSHGAVALDKKQVKKFILDHTDLKMMEIRELIKNWGFDRAHNLYSEMNLT